MARALNQQLAHHQPEGMEYAARGDPVDDTVCRQQLEHPEPGRVRRQEPGVPRENQGLPRWQGAVPPVPRRCAEGAPHQSQ